MSNHTITLYPEEKVFRPAPANMAEEDRHLFEHDLETTLTEANLQIVRNAHVLRDLFIGFRPLRWYEKESRWEPLKWKQRVRNLIQLGIRPKKISEAVWIHAEWSYCYFHWICDALPRALAVIPKHSKAPVFLSNYYQKWPFVEQTLKYFGIDVLFYDEKSHYVVKELVVPDHVGRPGNFRPLLMQDLRTRMIGNQNTVATRRVFVSREKAVQRFIQNEKDVQQLLKKYGFEVHYFEDYSFQQQIELLKTTKCLIGIHGAGLTNMIMMPKGGSILELRHKDESVINCFVALSATLGHSYFYQKCDGDGRGTHSMNAIVDLEVLEKNVKQMVM